MLGINCECFSSQGKSDVRLVQCTKRFALRDLNFNYSTHLTRKIVNVLEFRFQLIGKVNRAVYCLDRNHRNRPHSGHSDTPAIYSYNILHTGVWLQLQ